jgi:unsaturated rhamnogalacturonyl hydrolase
MHRYDTDRKGWTRSAVMLAALVGCADLSAAPFESDAVRLRVRGVAGWQMENRDANTLNLQSWLLAPFYAGAVRAAAVTGDPGYYDAMRQVGDLAQWQPGPRTYHADDHAVGMMYFAASRLYGEAAYSAAMIDRLDFILANPSAQGVNDRYTSANPAVTGQVMRWWWCDALYMAPPVCSMRPPICRRPRPPGRRCAAISPQGAS